MLLTLNDDCLYQIMKNLDLQDFLNLTEVSRELKNFIENQFKRCSLGTSSTFTPKFFKQIMENSNGSIQCTAKLLYTLEDSLKILQFPGITSLTLFVDGFEKKAADKLELLIVQIFPNLEILTIQGNLRFKYISKMEYLRKLTVDSDVLEKCSLKKLERLKLRSLCLKKPLQKLSFIKSLVKLKNLQELNLNIMNYVDLVMNYGFKLLPNLKKLKLSDVKENFFLLLKDSRYYRKIKRISFNLTIDIEEPVFRTFLAKMTKLRHLTITKDNGFILKLIHNSDMVSWQTLKEINYLNCEVSSVENEQSTNLLQMVENCKNLKVLDISGSAFGIEFLQQIINVMQFPSRTHKLTLRCYNTEIMRTKELPTLPKNLNLSFKQFYYQLPAENEIEIDFKAEHNIEETLQYSNEILKYCGDLHGNFICDIMIKELNRSLIRHFSTQSGIINLPQNVYVYAISVVDHIKMMAERTLCSSIFDNA